MQGEESDLAERFLGGFGLVRSYGFPGDNEFHIASLLSLTLFKLPICLLLGLAFEFSGDPRQG